MNWLRKLMIGRYGNDQLSTVLIVLSVIITLIARLISFPLLSLISYIPLGICLLRMFSKDIEKRRMENYKFSIFISPLYSKFSKTVNRIKDSKTHKIFKCPTCNTNLRVPKGKGKITIYCPKCKTEISRRT